MVDFNHVRADIVLVFVVPGKDGKPTFKRITLSNVRPDLTAVEIEQVSAALAGLIKHPLNVIQRVLYESVS